MDTSPMSARADKQRGNSSFVGARLEISGVSLLFWRTDHVAYNASPLPATLHQIATCGAFCRDSTRVPPPDGKQFLTKLPFELAANSAPAGVNTVIAADLRSCEDRRPNPYSTRREPTAKPSVALE